MASIRYSVLPLLLVTAFWLRTASAQSSSLYYCYGGYCGPSQGSYSGPMGTYSPNAGGSSGGDNLGGAGIPTGGLNERKYDAYRYGHTQELEKYRAEFENQLVQYKAAGLNQQAKAAQLQQITTDVHASLLITYPVPTDTGLSAEQRRSVNPLPPGVNETKLQTRLDPIWKEVKSGNPLGVARELNRLAQKQIPLPGAGDGSAEIANGEARALQKELAISKITNAQGLIEAPFATTPNQALRTSPRSYDGAEIRTGMNKMLAAQSVLGAKCAAGGGTPDLCGKVRASLQGQLASYSALDYLVAEQAEGINPSTRLLAEQLKAAADFAAGTAAGIYSGAESLVDGLAKLATTPEEVLVAFGQALVHFPRNAESHRGDSS